MMWPVLHGPWGTWPSQGMTQVAKDTGLSRESLYRALSAVAIQSFRPVLKVAKALGLPGFMPCRLLVRV